MSASSLLNTTVIAETNDLIVTAITAMESCLSPAIRSEPCSLSMNLPSISSLVHKRHKPKGSKDKTKIPLMDRLQPVLKSSDQISTSRDIGDIDNPISVITVSTTAIGVDDTRKVELLREGYFKSKIRADEFLSLVAAERESLSARGWVAGEDLYSFKAKSNEKKQQFHQANRLYYGLSTLLYASIGAMKANELDVYVRRKALLLPESIFDIREWDQFLLLAKECRSKEWRDDTCPISPIKENVKLLDQSNWNQSDEVSRLSDATVKGVEIENNESQKPEEKNANSNLLINISIAECIAKAKSLKEEHLMMKCKIRDCLSEENKYMESIASKIISASKSADCKSDGAKIAFDYALKSVDVERNQMKLIIEKYEENRKNDFLLIQNDFDEKLRSLRKGHEIELLEKEQQRLFLSNENESLVVIYDHKLDEYKALEEKLLETELANKLFELKIKKIDENEEEKRLSELLKEISEDEEIEKKGKNDLISKKAELSDMQIIKRDTDKGQNTVECQTDNSFEDPELILALKERISQLEKDFLSAKAAQVNKKEDGKDKSTEELDRNDDQKNNVKDDDNEKEEKDEVNILKTLKSQGNKRMSLAMVEVERFVAEEARKEAEQDEKDEIEKNENLRKINELTLHNKVNGINMKVDTTIKSPKPEDNEVFTFDEFGNRSPVSRISNVENDKNNNGKPSGKNLFMTEFLSVKEWDENSPSRIFETDENGKENKENIIKNLEIYDENDDSNSNDNDNDILNSSYQNMMLHMIGIKKDFDINNYILDRKEKEEKNIELALVNAEETKSEKEIKKLKIEEREKELIAEDRERVRERKV